MSALSDERLQEIAARIPHEMPNNGEIVVLATELLALRAELAGVRAGTHRIVPVEPTEAMIAAGWIDKEDVNPDDIYRAMLAATGGTDG